MVANVVERQTVFMTRVYGAGKIVRLIQRLQRETDVQVCIIMDVFLEKKNIARLLNDLKNGGGESVDTREIDLVATEIVMMSSKVQLFESFLKRTAQVFAILFIV